MDTKIQGCSIRTGKNIYSTSIKRYKQCIVGTMHLGMENTGFHLSLVESVDVKLRDTAGQLYIYFLKYAYK